MEKINNSYDGFTLIESKELSDIDSIALVFEHDKTKAKVVKLLNDDQNKAFAIAFKTLPENSTGLAHIMEHAVLNGSEHYTTREPFMDLLKSSLQTFLNAMTYPDKTCYPVASRNAKDFKNLVDVYLDAVFNPLVYKNKNTFYQEGWHYEIKDPKDPIVYNGVVYNEMKGAYSTGDSIVFSEINKNLYPDTVYSVESGGYPYEIPELSYEDFLAFHKKYYHPSNSYIYFYGDGDIENELNHIKKFLDKYDYKKIDNEIKAQEAFEEIKRVEKEYNIGKDEDPKNKDYLVYAVNTGLIDDSQDLFSSSILNDILFSNESALIKERLLAEGICESVDVISPYGKQISLGIIAENADAKNIEIFENIINEELEKLVKNGIDKEELEASLNKTEYDLKEAGEFHTKGIIYILRSLSSFLYTDSYDDQLQFSDTIKKLRELIDTDYYENFIKEKILDNNFKLVMTVKASPGLNDEKDRQQAEKLAKFKEGLSDEEINNLIKMNKELEEFQSKEDSQEQKDTIPSLELSDIDPHLERVITHIDKKDEYTIINPDLFTSGIHYTQILFDLGRYSQEDFFYLSLLTDYIGKSDTENYDYKKLFTKSYLVSGGINSSLKFAEDSKTGKLKKYFTVNFKTTDDKAEDLVKFLGELLFKVKFDDPKRFKDILLEIKSAYRYKILTEGNGLAVLRSMASFSEKAVYQEEVAGFSYYFKLVDILDDFDEKGQEVLDKMKSYYDEITNINGMIINIIDEEDGAREFSTQLLPLIEKLDKNPFDYSESKVEFISDKEGFKTSSDVNYVVKTADLSKFNYIYNSKSAVLSNLLNNSYLYGEIRAKGGAYGVYMNIDLNSKFNVFSYRDPNIKRTIEVYDNIKEFIENMDFTDEEIKQFIIGSVNKFNPPMTTVTKGTRALNMYLTERSIEDYENYLSLMLETSLDDLKAYADIIDMAMKENNLSVVGNYNAIEENKEFFDKTIQVEK